MVPRQAEKFARISDMQIAAGGYINITNVDDMYGISQRDFDRKRSLLFRTFFYYKLFPLFNSFYASSDN